MSTLNEFAGPPGEGLTALRAELDRLIRAKDHAMAAYIAHVHAQRGLTGEELQRATDRTAEAQAEFERLNDLVYDKQNEVAALQQTDLALDAA